MLSVALRTCRTLATGIVAVAVLAAAGPFGRADDRFSWLRRPTAWEIRWSRPISAADPVVVARLVAWNDAGAVHAARAADGLPAWRIVPPSDTLLFPRSLGPPRRSAAPREPCPASLAVVGHLLYAVVDAGAMGQQIVCLDCSHAAEGRLLWAAEPLAGGMGFDGPPVADHEVCVVVARAADRRGPLQVVVHDARDGTVVWRQTLGTGIARDGMDHARGERVASLIGPLVVVVDHAGGVWAFDREGRLAWRHDYATQPSRGNAATSSDGFPATSGSVAAADGKFITAPWDRGGLIAIAAEAPSRGAAWETAPGDRLRIVGVADGFVVTESLAASTRGELAVRAARDGRLLATAGSDVAAGSAVMVGGVILQPWLDAAVGSWSIAVIDPATLEQTEPPFSLTAAPPAVATPPAAGAWLHLAAVPPLLVAAGPRELVCIGARQ